MSLSKKSTYPLFESVCVLEGLIQNQSYHEDRFKMSFQKFYWERPNFNLFKDISIPRQFKKGCAKLRISYGKNGKKVTFGHYLNRKVKKLKIVIDDAIEYDLKFEDRTQLNYLFKQRSGCDDILIVKNGLITDTSYANIIFHDGQDWLTPESCLLKGTKRDRLLKDGVIQESEIPYDSIRNFKGFQLINAMMDFNADTVLPIENIMD